MFFHTLPDYEIAKQIAHLVNVYNGLSLKRRSIDIIESRINYVVETHGKFVIGAVGVEKVSFVFSEIKHLVVRPEWRRKRVGQFVTRRALDQVVTPLIYCTIRTDNKASIRLFEGLGFRRVEQYPADGHDVTLLARTSPTWKKKCSNPTWKSDSLTAEMWMCQEPTSEPSSWEYDTLSPPPEDS